MKSTSKIITAIMGSVLMLTSLAAPAQATNSRSNEVSSRSVPSSKAITEKYRGDSAPLDLKLLNKTAIVSYVGVSPANSKAIRTGTQCVDENHHLSWYGMTVQRCKAASGSKFTVYNATSGKVVSVIQLRKIAKQKVLGSRKLSLGCKVAAASFILSIPGSPTDVVGWVLKGSTVLLSAWGIGLSCP